MQINLGVSDLGVVNRARELVCEARSNSGKLVLMHLLDVKHGWVGGRET